jgi:hypothetical protein
MKNKHKRQFVNSYKWWDHSFLFMAIRDWLDNASKMTLKHGVHINNEKTARKMKIIALAIDAYVQDELQSNKVFKSRNYIGLYKFDLEKHEWRKKRQDARKQYIFDMLSKHIEGFWD